MAFCPYFRSGIDELQQATENARIDFKKLKVIQYKLRYREWLKAQALKTEVDEWIHLLIAGDSVPLVPSNTTFALKHATKRFTFTNTTGLAQVMTPNRVVVECIHCETPNFVSTVGNAVQYLHCFTCKAPFTAEFKNSALRTDFLPIQPQRSTVGFSGKYFAFALAARILIIILV